MVNSLSLQCFLPRNTKSVKIAYSNIYRTGITGDTAGQRLGPVIQTLCKWILKQRCLIAEMAHE